MVEPTIVRGAGRNKRAWTPKEDTKLIDALMEVHVSGKYSGADNGFKPRYVKVVQSLLDVTLPNAGLKAEPHIKSMMKTLKSNFSIVHDMLVDTNTSGFGWNSNTCCIDAEYHVWDEYIKFHKAVANFRGKPFPFYEKLFSIYGKYRAIGSQDKDLGDEDIVIEETQESPTEVDLEVPMSGGDPSNISSKQKRSKIDDFDDTFKECLSDLTGRMEHSLGMLGDKLVASANQDISNDILDDVIMEIQNLQGITTHQCLRGMHVISRDASKAHIFLRSSEGDRITYIQMLEEGPLYLVYSLCMLVVKLLS